MRNDPTPAEKHLWRHLSRSQLGGFKFRRQSVIGSFIVDFFCPAKGLIIEVDGDTHDRQLDASRDAALAGKGFQTLRFTNRDVACDMEAVLTAILAKLLAMPDRWPHPNPPPEGEGLAGS